MVFEVIGFKLHGESKTTLVLTPEAGNPNHNGITVVVNLPPTGNPVEADAGEIWNNVAELINSELTHRLWDYNRQMNFGYTVNGRVQLTSGKGSVIPGVDEHNWGNGNTPQNYAAENPVVLELILRLSLRSHNKKPIMDGTKFGSQNDIIFSNLSASSNLNMRLDPANIH